MARPFLDVSMVLLDPMLADSFKVTRRIEVINTYGEVVTVRSVVPDVVGTVNMAGPNDLQRLDDQQRTGRVLSIITRFKLRATAPGYQPDLIEWNGDQYVVADVDLYTRYGYGFVQALAGSIVAQDRAPLTGAPSVGQFDFEDGRQAPLLRAA